MALQKTVNTEYARGVAGDPVNISLGQIAFTPIQRIAETDVAAGSFVFNGTNPYTQVKATGDVVAGLVVREQNHANYDLASSGTLTIRKGGNVTVAVAGDFYIDTGAAAGTVGQKVVVNKNTGAVSFNDSVGDNELDTGWVVSNSVANELTVISKH